MGTAHQAAVTLLAASLCPTKQVQGTLLYEVWPVPRRELRSTREGQLPAGPLRELGHAKQQWFLMVRRPLSYVATRMRVACFTKACTRASMDASEKVVHGPECVRVLLAHRATLRVQRPSLVGARNCDVNDR